MLLGVSCHGNDSSATFAVHNSPLTFDPYMELHEAKGLESHVGRSFDVEVSYELGEGGWLCDLRLVSATIVADDFDLSQIDHGVRKLVGYLRRRNFRTTDSGDGVSKLADVPDDATDDDYCMPLDYPHVFMVAEGHDAAAEARRLHKVVREELKCTKGHVTLHYSPDDGVPVLEVSHVLDADCTFPEVLP